LDWPEWHREYESALATVPARGSAARGLEEPGNADDAATPVSDAVFGAGSAAVGCETADTENVGRSADWVIDWLPEGSGLGVKADERPDKAKLAVVSYSNSVMSDSVVGARERPDDDADAELA
jgi:hypothetical protein